MKYTNINIRKSYKYKTMLTVVGIVFCLISLLLCITSIYFVNKAKNNVRPMKEILSEGGKHAAKPAFLEISEVPVKVAQNKYEDYYLVTDGSAYYISSMTEENYRRFISLSESSGHMRLEGITHVIADKEAKNQIADSLSKKFGKEISSEYLDNYIGDVSIRATEITTKSLIKNIYIIPIAFAITSMIFGIAFLIYGTSGLARYRKMTCIEEITPDVLDKEANADDSKWLKHSKIYLTPTLIAGFSNGITALRYDELVCIYGENKNPDNPRDKFSIIATAIDGKEYTISEMIDMGVFDELIFEELDMIYRECKIHKPGIKCGKCEGSIEYLDFTYPFSLNIYNEDASDETKKLSGHLAYEMIDENVREDICYYFKSSQLYKYFNHGQDVIDLTLTFKEEGYILIRASVVIGRSQEIRESFERFLIGQLSDGLWESNEGEYYCKESGESYSISFIADSF